MSHTMQPDSPQRQPAKAVKRIVEAVKRRFSHGHKHEQTHPASPPHPRRSPVSISFSRSRRSRTDSEAFSQHSISARDVKIGSFGSEDTQRMSAEEIMSEDSHLMSAPSHAPASEIAPSGESVSTTLVEANQLYKPSGSEKAASLLSNIEGAGAEEAPDPFLKDDALDRGPEGAGLASPAVEPTEEISLTQQPSQTDASSSLPSLNVNKDVPPSPASEEEEESHDLYLPGLIMPTMFLPIPNTDPLTTLLTKYIPHDKRSVRDLSGEWHHADFHTLVMTNSWRALAQMARDRLVSANPGDLNLVLSLWYLRLSCLSRLRLYNQTSAECTNLFAVLNAVEPLAARTWLFERVLPFELEVMYTRLKYWAGDHMGYLDILCGLLKKCKARARLSQADETTFSMWQERGSRVCLIIASQLIEMKDLTAAANLLEPLCKQHDDITSPALQSAVGRIYLQGGYLSQASLHFSAVAADATAEQRLKDMNAALLASAEGEWSLASKILRNIVGEDDENYVAVNNLAVALLSQGRVKEGIDILETALRSSPSSVVIAEPYLFNLSTLYELRSTTAVDKKRDLLIEVAKWSGDGLKTTCLKMPSN